MNENQIKPLLHHTVVIKHSQDLNNFFRRKYKTSQTLSFKGSFLYNLRVSSVPDKVSSSFIRIVQNLKYVKRSRLLESDIMLTSDIKPSEWLYMVKRMPHSQSISLKGDFFSPNLPIKAKMWLKPLKKCKLVNYISIEEISSSEPRIRSFFSMMDRIRVKKLNVVEFFEIQANLSMLYQKYPRHLESLTISCSDEISHGEDFKNTLNHLTQLRTINFTLDLGNGVVLHLLNSISDLSHLTTLDLTILNSGVIENMTPALKRIQEINKLRALKLVLMFEGKGLGKILEAVKDCPITEFDLDCSIVSLDPINCLPDFLDSVKGFESIRFYFQNDLSYRALPPAFLSALKEAIVRSNRLKVFSLEADTLNTPTSFSDLIDSLMDKALMLREVKIKVGTFEPTKEQFQKVLSFLQNLTVIEILELGGLTLTKSTLIQKLIDIACSWNSLRILGLEEVPVVKPVSSFVKLIEKILIKRGIERFSCIVSSESRILLSEIASEDFIDMNLVRLKNPFLEIYPESLPIYKHRLENELAIRIE